MLADGIDEGAAVEALLAEPALQRREDPRQLGLRIAAAGLHCADEPFAPLLALVLEHRMHEVGLGAEQLVERRLRSTRLIDDRVDPGGVDAVLAEQMRRCGKQSAARRFIVASRAMRGGWLFPGE